MRINWQKIKMINSQLLQKKEWKTKREKILQRDNYCCQAPGCSNKEHLCVHHKQIHFDVSTRGHMVPARRLPWTYPDNLLITLCDKCHAAGHCRIVLPKFWVRTQRSL